MTEEIEKVISAIVRNEAELILRCRSYSVDKGLTHKHRMQLQAPEVEAHDDLFRIFRKANVVIMEASGPPRVIVVDAVTCVTDV